MTTNAKPGSIVKKQIILVEDDDVYRKSMQRVLEDLGYDVHAVCKAEDALDVFDQTGVSVVLTDYNLPGMNGLALAGLLRKRSGNVPVILLTGMQRRECFDAAVDKKINAVLLKPVDLLTLERTIAETILQSGN